MSTLLARKLARHVPWLPRGAKEHFDLRSGRYFAGRRDHATLAAAFAAAGFTFARASQGSYFGDDGILAYAASGTPRLDYHPATLAPLGLLLERAMTPLSTNGEAIDNAYWSKNNNAAGTPLANQDVAPDGTTTADRFVPYTGTSSSIQFYKTVGALTSGVKHSLSAFAKPDPAAGIRYLVLGMLFGGTLKSGWLDLPSRVAGANQNGGVLVARPAGNGYVRGGCTATPTGTSLNISFQPASSNGSLSFTGDSAKYATVWGVQFEQGDFATSYNGGVARSADSLTRTIAPADHFVRVIGFTAPPGLSTNVVWQMDDGTPANCVRLVRDTAGAMRLVVTLASSETVNLALGTVANESFNRVAIAYDGAAFRVVMNAAAAVQTAVAAMPPVTTERLGSSATAGEEFCGWLGEFTTYDSLADGGLREASRVFPSWVQTDSANQPADLFMDFVNGRFWANGRVYPTLATFQAALGATTYAEGDWEFPWADASVSLVLEVLPDSASGLGRQTTFVAIDNGASGRYQKAYLGTVNAIGGRAFWGSNQWYQEASGLVAKYWPSRFALTFQSNNFSLSKDGKPPNTQTSGSDIGAPTTFRVGNNYARTEGLVDGEIWKIAVFQAPKSSSEVQALANADWPLIGGGDSYMGGAGNVGVQQSISRLRRRLMLNAGVGGSTLAEQAVTSVAAITAWPNAIFVHWDGDDNGFDPDITVDLGNYATIVGALTHEKFVIVSPMPRAAHSAPQRQRCRDLYTALAAAYPGHVVDPLPIVLTLADPVADAADIAADQCPSSQLQDGVHLKQAAMDLVVTAGVLPIIDAGGWLPAE